MKKSTNYKAKQSYLPMIIESTEYRAVLHSNVFDLDILAIPGKTIDEAIEFAKKQLPKLNEMHRDNLTMSKTTGERPVACLFTVVFDHAPNSIYLHNPLL